MGRPVHDSIDDIDVSMDTFQRVRGGLLRCWGRRFRIQGPQTSSTTGGPVVVVLKIFRVFENLFDDPKRMCAPSKRSKMCKNEKISDLFWVPRVSSMRFFWFRECKEFRFIFGGF